MRSIILISIFLFFSTVKASTDEPIMSKIGPVPATDFTLPDINENIVNFSDHKGKYILVNFWAIWCPPCVKEFPSMQTLYENLKDENLEIIAVHAGPVDGDLTSFLEDNNISFEVLIDKDISVKGWKVAGLPISYLVDPKGQIIYQAIGPRDWGVDAMRELITSAK
ncbi:MAG: peroxiredoxin family protein [Gammaproteobacteria bacterium]